MKTKILIVILAVVIIACGVLLGIKYMSKKSDAKEENIAEGNTTIEEEKEEDNTPKTKYSGNQRTIAVMIDNVGDARPQTSLNKAMIVYEAYVEGGLTRYLAVYKNEDIETIGPTRSARPVFIDYALENDSIFVHYGGSPRALDDVKKLKMDNANGIESPANVFRRTKEKAAPHNALTGTKVIWEYASKQGYRKTTKERNVLNYVVEEVTLEEGTGATTVNIPYSGAKVKYVYNIETGLYERYFANKLQTDWLTKEKITTKNIIITIANNYSTDEEGGYGRQQIENIGNLDGYYITNGKAIKIKCEKKTRSGKTVYKDLEGNEIKVNDGNTYIQIVSPSMNITME